MTVEIQDKNGNLCTQDARKVSYTADGADILGVASGDLVCEDIYTSAKERKVYHGKSVVVLKKHKNAEKSIITATSEDFNATIEI